MSKTKVVQKITKIFRFVADNDREIVRITELNGNMRWIRRDTVFDIVLVEIIQDGDHWILTGPDVEIQEFKNHWEATRALHEWISDYVDGGLNAEVV